MVGNSYSPPPSSRVQEALEEAKERIQDTWEQRKPPRPETVRRAGLLALIAVVAAALLIIPQTERDPAAEVFAGQAPIDPNTDGESQDVTEPTYTEPTYEVSDSSLEVNESDSWSSSLQELETMARAELVLFRSRTTTTAAPTTEAPTTQPPTTQATTTTAAPTTAAPTTESEATTTAGEVEVSDEEQSAAPADDTTTSGSTETTEVSESTVEETTTTVEETTTTAPPTTAAPTTAAENGFVDAGHGVFVPPILLEIRRCESGGNYQAANPSSSARGAYQFLTGSWEAYGHAARYGVSRAHHATNAQQDEAALITWQRDGTRPWNASRHCWG